MDLHEWVVSALIATVVCAAVCAAVVVFARCRGGGDEADRTRRGGATLGAQHVQFTQLRVDDSDSDVGRRGSVDEGEGEGEGGGEAGSAASYSDGELDGELSDHDADVHDDDDDDEDDEGDVGTDQEDLDGLSDVGVTVESQ